jgi:hypothetical protein
MINTLLKVFKYKSLYKNKYKVLFIYIQTRPISIQKIKQ